MKLSYKQFIELCNPGPFEFDELSDGMIIWWQLCAYGTIHIITDCNWSHRGSRVSFDKLNPHIIRIYVERKFRGEVWDVDYNQERN